MSITTFENKKQIFFSYSPPLYSNSVLEPDLPFTLTPPLNGYTDEIENASGKELSCGYPCSYKDGKLQITPDGKQYMCGSIVHPTIKTPPRYAVYQIYEKT